MSSRTLQLAKGAKSRTPFASIEEALAAVTTP